MRMGSARGLTGLWRKIAMEFLTASDLTIHHKVEAQFVKASDLTTNCKIIEQFPHPSDAMIEPLCHKIAETIF